jgi:hypothetical protein
VQFPAQVVVPHEYGVHSCSWTGAHEPSPAHTCASVATSPTHLPAAQIFAEPG